MMMGMLMAKPESRATDLDKILEHDFLKVDEDFDEAAEYNLVK